MKCSTQQTAQPRGNHRNTGTDSAAKTAYTAMATVMRGTCGRSQTVGMRVSTMVKTWMWAAGVLNCS